MGGADAARWSRHEHHPPPLVPQRRRALLDRVRRRAPEQRPHLRQREQAGGGQVTVGELVVKLQAIDPTLPVILIEEADVDGTRCEPREPAGMIFEMVHNGEEKTVMAIVRRGGFLHLSVTEPT